MVCAVFPLETSHAVAVISVPPKYMLTSISRSLPFELSGVSILMLPILFTPGSVVYLVSGLVVTWKLIETIVVSEVGG